MIISILSIVAMTGMFLLMINRAKYASTRRIALLPLICAGMELFAAGLLTPQLFPVFTIILVFLRLIILICCASALKKDAVMSKHRKHRKHRKVSDITYTLNTSENEKYCA